MGTMVGNLLHVILYWLVSGLAVLLTARLVRGFKVGSFSDAVIAALGIGLANAVIWPVLFYLTLPINVLTLGLFTFVVNAAVLKICAALLPGFDIKGWWAAIFGSIVLSLISLMLHYFLV
jgi:putative membrane protein